VPAPLPDVEISNLERVLQSLDGNEVRAAKILSISHSRLYRILQESSASTQNA
jgi:DNA-binding protein Fis